VAIPPKIYPLE